MIRLGALFAGVGGLELGLENAFKVAGVRVETVYQVELDDAARKVLKAHWPHARHYADITAIETHSLPDADLIAGGFPCQDLSVAGRGAGIEHGKRSSLWRVFKEIVHVKQPALVVVENVNQGRERWLPTVTSDLASLGYQCAAYRVAAGELGAPHERARAFVLAYAHGEPLRQLAKRMSGRRAGVLRGPWEAQSRHDGHPWLAPVSRSWSTRPALRRMDDGLPSRMDGRRLNQKRLQRLKMIGNAVSPVVSYVLGLELIRIVEEAFVERGL